MITTWGRVLRAVRFHLNRYDKNVRFFKYWWPVYAKYSIDAQKELLRQQLHRLDKNNVIARELLNTLKA